jgi:hypothetical protein
VTVREEALVPEFLIEIPHSPQECSAAVSEVVAHPLARELEAHTYWGCRVGAHTTWIVGAFESEPAATRIVPELLRDTARVVRVDRGAEPYFYK